MTVLLFPLWPAATTFAQQPETTPNVVHVVGLEDVKRNAKGTLTVKEGTLQFSTKTARAEVPYAWIQDIFTRDDSRQVAGGPVTLLVPFGGGRLLGLFRRKVDALTVEYRDPNGALHGVIFTLPEGQAAVVKKQMVAQGAHASIPVEEEQVQQIEGEITSGEKKQ